MIALLKECQETILFIGAGHDAGHLARITQAGMIFVPSKVGEVIALRNGQILLALASGPSCWEASLVRSITAM